MIPIYEAAWQVHRFLTLNKIPYAIIGGFAVQHWGVPRVTVDVDLTIPAAEGVWPYPGQATCQAEVIRVDRGSWKTGAARFGIAARFLDRLRFSY